MRSGCIASISSTVTFVVAANLDPGAQFAKILDEVSE